MQFVQFSYFITANRTARYGVVRCGAVHYYLTCGAVRLCYFAGGFGAVFAVCAVCAVW